MSVYKGWGGEGGMIALRGGGCKNNLKWKIRKDEENKRKRKKIVTMK